MKNHTAETEVFSNNSSSALIVRPSIGIGHRIKFTSYRPI